jgi:hypothetical protein
MPHAKQQAKSISSPFNPRISRSPETPPNTRLAVLSPFEYLSARGPMADSSTTEGFVPENLCTNCARIERFQLIAPIPAGSVSKPETVM